MCVKCKCLNCVTAALPAAAAREVWHNHKHMAERGQPLSDDPFWYYVIQNAPNSLYQGYKQSLYGLVS